MNDRASTQAGYSPEISAQLLIHGERLDVATFGPRGIVLRSAKLLPPGEGTIRMQVDGRETIYRVQFPEGIDPSRNRQVYWLINTSESEEAAAVAPSTVLAIPPRGKATSNWAMATGISQAPSGIHCV